MRIEYIVQARMPTEKAHGLQIAHMCNALAQLGHDVILVVPKRARLISEDVFSYYGIPKRFSVHILWSPDLVSVWGRFGAWVYWLHSSLFIVRLLFYRPEAESLIYTRTPEIAWLFTLRGYRVVCEIHDWPESHSSLFRYFLKKAQLLPCNSPGTERMCRAHGLSQTIVAHNGIDSEEFSKVFNKNTVREELGLPQDMKIVMYIGALEKWKGVETLCEAASLLPVDMQVVVIGGMTQTQFNDVSIRYPKVAYLGPRPYRELAKNQSAADVLVVPNIPENEESAEYTSPIKLFAHMASGVPVVVSDLPSLRAIVSEESAFFFKAGDVQALTAKILQVLSESHDAQIRASHAKGLVQKYSWNTRATKILAALEKSKR